MNIKKIISIILGVVSIVMIGFGVYLMNSKEYIFRTAVSNVFESIKEKYDKLTDDLNDLENFNKIKYNTSTNLSLMNKNFASVEGDVFVDVTSQKGYLDVNTKVADEDFLAIEGLIQDKKVYVKIKEIMDKFYYEDTEMEFSTSKNELTDKDFNILMDHLEKSVIKSITKDYLNKSSQSIKIENNEYRVTKVDFNITQKNYMGIMRNFLEAISNDNNAIRVLQKFEKSITKASIQEVLSRLNSSNSELTDEVILNFAFYITGSGTLRRIELTEPSLSPESLLTLDVHNNEKNQKTYILTAGDGDQILTCKFTYITEATVEILITASGVQIQGELTNKEKEKTLNLTLITNGITVGKLEYKLMEVVEEQQYKLELNVSSQGIFKLTSNNTITLGGEVPNIDVDDAKTIEDMTDEEKEEISTYIEEKLNDLGLENYFDNKHELNEEDSVASHTSFGNVYFNQLQNHLSSELKNSFFLNKLAL